MCSTNYDPRLAPPTNDTDLDDNTGDFDPEKVEQILGWAMREDFLDLPPQQVADLIYNLAGALGADGETLAEAMRMAFAIREGAENEELVSERPEEEVDAGGRDE